MILYHGSYTAVERPDLSFSRAKTDFGRGFYLTPFKEQAGQWAERFLRYNKPNFQYCFKTQSILDRYVGFIEARNVNASA